MAREYTPGFMDEEQDGQSPQTPAMVPSQPGTQGSIPQTSPLAAPQTQRKASTGFTNLKKYIQANRQNQLATQVAKPVESKLQQAQSTLAQSHQEFQNQLQKQTKDLEAAKSKGQQALGYIESGSQPLVQQPAPQLAARPEAPTDTWAEDYEAKKAAYEAQKTAYDKSVQDQQAYNEGARKAAQEALTGIRDYRYSGPTSLENADKIAQQQLELQQIANATKTEGGRGALLQNLFSKSGQYTGGAKNLDSLFLSSSPQALKRLQDIRLQTGTLGQNLKRADIESAANVGASLGKIDTAQALQKNAMQTLRDKIKQNLEAEAAAYNEQARADAAEVSQEELAKWLPEVAGYDLVDLPGSVGLPGSDDLNPIAPNNNLSGVQLANDVISPTVQVAASPLQKYINLGANKNFEEFQKVDPNRSLNRDIKEAADFGHRDWTHTSAGSPNQQNAYVEASALNPLFKESYKDNTWESINADALERRNILSNVLADNAALGFMTPKERQEVQMQLDNELLSNLKGLPKGAEESYVTDFFTNAPASGGTIGNLQNYKQLGYEDPLQLAKDTGTVYNIPGLTKRIQELPGGGGNVTSNDLKYDPQTKTYSYEQGGTVRGQNNQERRAKVAEILKKYPNARVVEHPGSVDIFVPHTIPADKLIPQFLQQGQGFASGGFNNNASPTLVAKKVQERYYKDMLNKLLKLEADKVKVK